MILHNSKEKKALYKRKIIRKWLKYDLLKTFKDISKTQHGVYF